MSEFDFVVIGGGPAGATAAALLAQRGGKRIALCEQKVYPRHKVCGEFMSARVRPVLRQLGLEGEYDRLAGPPVRQVAAYLPEGVVLRGRTGADGDGALPQTLARDQLDAMLLRRAAELGATVLQPCLVNSVTGSAAEGFIIRTNTGVLKSRGVILAHGLAQRGDMHLQRVQPQRQRAEFVCFKAHFSGCAIADDTIAIAAAAGLYVGLVRTSDAPRDGTADGSEEKRYSLAFVVRRERLEQFGNSGEAQFAALLKQNAGFARLLDNATRLGPWLASGPLQPGVREVYRDGRFFVGNAAGEVHALVGEGITLALRGAVLLDTALAQHGTDALEAAGRAYRRQWQREFSRRYWAAGFFAGAMMRPGVASAIGRVLGAAPPLMDWCVRAAGK